MRARVILRGLFVFILLLLVGSIMNARKAAAFGLNPNPQILSDIRAVEKASLENCNGQPPGISPAFQPWLGGDRDGNNNIIHGATSIEVPYYATSANLTFNWASAPCSIPDNVPESRLNIFQTEVKFTDGTNAGRTDVPPNTVVALANGPDYVGQYRSTILNFKYLPSAPVNQDRTIVVRFHTQSINYQIPPSIPPGVDNYHCIGTTVNYWYGPAGKEAGNGWKYWNCPDWTVELTIDIHVSPVGGDIQGSCDFGAFDPKGGDNTPAAIKGWAQDLDYNYGWPNQMTSVRVFMDKRAYNGTDPAFSDLIPIGDFKANHYVSWAPWWPTGGPPAWHDWWYVPTSAIAQYNDGFRHTFIINVLNVDSNGSPAQWPQQTQVEIGRVTIGPCATPQCGTYTATPPGVVEAGVPFDATATFTYASGPKGIAAHNDIGLDVPAGTRRATVSDRYYASGNSPPLDLNGNPVGGTPTISNQVSANSITLATPGNYPVSWHVQWVIPDDPGLRTAYAAIGLGSYKPNANWYGTLDCSPATQKVGNKPYVKIYGNDISAGGGFGNSCTVTNDRATILTLLKEPNGASLADNSAPAGTPPVGPPDPFMGSSVELGAYSLGEIYDFYSAGNHSPRDSSNASSPTHGLTFGNYGIPAISGYDWDAKYSHSHLDVNKVINYGGKGGQSYCAPDYYNMHPSGSPTVPFFPIADLSSATSTLYLKPSSGPIWLVGTANVRNKHVVFVDGDVIIGKNGLFNPLNPNITYAGYSDAAHIPSLYVIAQGNIYISSETTTISGVFIAQPDPATGIGGNIYTCALGTTPVDQASLSATCGNQLTVSGAFIANQIKLLRTKGSLKDSVENETWSPSNAAEIFKSSPELYLGTPPTSLRKDGAFNGYDSITSLPPIL